MVLQAQILFEPLLGVFREIELLAVLPHTAKADMPCFHNRIYSKNQGFIHF